MADVELTASRDRDESQYDRMTPTNEDDDGDPVAAPDYRLSPLIIAQADVVPSFDARTTARSMSPTRGPTDHGRPTAELGELSEARADPGSAMVSGPSSNQSKRRATGSGRWDGPSSYSTIRSTL